MQANSAEEAIPAGRALPGDGDEASPRVSSKALLGSRRELLIDHDGREYRLRVTQNGKLILTA
jgi:hemin uptake protein HemP